MPDVDSFSFELAKFPLGNGHEEVRIPVIERREVWSVSLGKLATGAEVLWAPMCSTILDSSFICVSTGMPCSSHASSSSISSVYSSTECAISAIALLLYVHSAREEITTRSRIEYNQRVKELEKLCTGQGLTNEDRSARLSERQTSRDALKYALKSALGKV